MAAVAVGAALGPPSTAVPPLQHVLIVVPFLVTVATAAVPFRIRLRAGSISINSSGPVARPLRPGLLCAH